MGDVVDGRMFVSLGMFVGFMVDHFVGLFVVRVLLQHVVLPEFQQQ